MHLGWGGHEPENIIETTPKHAAIGAKMHDFARSTTWVPATSPGGPVVANDTGQNPSEDGGD